MQTSSREPVIPPRKKVAAVGMYCLFITSVTLLAQNLERDPRSILKHFLAEEFTCVAVYIVVGRKQVIVWMIQHFH